jgi:hypothetical protein
MRPMRLAQLTKADEAMHGPDVTREKLFSIRQTAGFVPAAHPLPAMREILNRAPPDIQRTARGAGIGNFPGQRQVFA